MPTAPGAESKFDSFQQEIRTFGSEASDFLGRLEGLLERLDQATPDPGETRAHSFASAYVTGALDDFRSAKDLLRLAEDVDEDEIRRVESQDRRADDAPPLELKARLTGCVTSAYSIVQELEHIERDLVLGSAEGELLPEGPPTAEGMTYGLLRAAHMTLYETVGLLLRAASQDEDEVQQVRSLLQLARDVRAGAEWREQSDVAFSSPSLATPSAMPATPTDAHGESNADQTGSRQAESAWSAVPDAGHRVVSSLERRAKELYVAARAVEFSRGESFLVGEGASDEEAFGYGYQALGVAVKSLRLSSSLLRQAWLPQNAADRAEALEPYEPSIRTLMRKAFAVTIAAAQLKASLIPAQAKLPDIENTVGDLGRSVSILGKLVELLVFRMGLTTEQTAGLWQLAHSDADSWQDES